MTDFEHTVINKLREMRHLVATQDEHQLFSNAVEAAYDTRACLMKWYKHVNERDI